MGSLSPPQTEADSPSKTPYWNINVPEEHHTKECPEFLRNLNDHDRRILETPDEEYHVLTWAEVQGYIRDNRLDLFQRVPSDLIRYFRFNWGTKQKYGSVMNFILTQKLHWPADGPIIPKGGPFECPREDISIKWNDWPYGIDERVVHLVVWTKFALEEDPVTTDITPKARSQVDEYVWETFGKVVGRENVIWFKNWAALKSVRSVEHFHVMMFNPDPGFVDELTEGDEPFFKKVPNSRTK